MQRPTEVTVLAILHLIFGVMGVCGLLVALALLAAPDLNPAGAQNAVMTEMQNMPASKTMNLIGMPLGMVAIAVKIICALGMLKLLPWSRRVMLIVSVYECLSTIISTMVMFFFVMLPLTEMFKDGNPAEKMQTNMMLVFSPLSAIFGLILPAITIWLLRKRNVVDAFAGSLPAVSPSDLRPFRETGNPYQSP